MCTIKLHLKFNTSGEMAPEEKHISFQRPITKEQGNITNKKMKATMTFKED